jgi:adenosine deaminase
MKQLLTENFIKRVPKADLHLHLDGSLRLGTLIELARQDGVRLPSYEEAGLCETVFKPDYANLGEYLKGFAYTCAVLRTPENLERVAFELAEDCLAEGVRYIEVRFAPQLLVHDELSIPATVEAVARGLERARTAHRQAREPDDLDFEYGIILCAMRRFNRHMGDYYANLLGLLGEAPHKDVYALASLEMARVAVALRDKQGLPVVGFDLAGEEAGYPASYHTEAYQYVHSHFMSKTVHAGEAYGPESIFQALTECHANRIGHGTFLFSPETIRDRHIRDREGYVEQLVEYIARQRINIEVCLTSNQQTIPSIDALAGHPLTRMLEHNLSVSICTDNRLVSHTTMTRELMRAVNEVGVTPRQFRNIIMAGFKGSFFGRSYNERRQYVRRVMDRYDQLAVGY